MPGQDKLTVNVSCKGIKVDFRSESTFRVNMQCVKTWALQDKTIHPPTAPKHNNLAIKVLPPSQNARHIQHNNIGISSEETLSTVSLLLQVYLIQALESVSRALLDACNNTSSAQQLVGG